MSGPAPGAGPLGGGDLPREVHDRLNLSATGGVPDPRGAAALVPPEAPAGASPVPLPLATLPAVDLTATVDARRSSYRFAPEQPTLPDLAALLGTALGPGRTVRTPAGARTLTRSPSAGGLPSLEAYVVARGPGLLAAGVHRADLGAGSEAGTGGPALVPVRLGDPTAFLAAALDQPEFATRATAVVALVASLDATLGKYPPRHYRTLHLDAGVALGHLWLAATALELPACAVMGFDDTALDALLGLGPGRFTAVLLALSGRGSAAVR